MTDDLLSFEVARPTRGNVVSIDGDGEMTLRLVVAPSYRDAVLELADILRAEQPVRLVAVAS